MRSWIVALGCLAFLASGSDRARAQSLSTFRIQLFPLTGTSPFVADWQTVGTLASALVFNTAPEPVIATIAANISRDGVSVGSAGARTQLFLPGTWQHVTQNLANWASLQLTGEVGEHAQKTGRVPDGTYTLCLLVLDVRTQSGAPVLLQTPFVCVPFTVNFPKAPSLVYPGNDSAVPVPLPTFQWIPLILAGGKGVPHQFRLVEVLPLQTPLQAIEANRPILETYVSQASSLPYPSSAPYLLEGRRYAWRVQAVYSIPGQAGFSGSRSGIIRPIGQNDGKSQVFTFTWRSAAGARGGPGSAAAGPAGTEKIGSAGASAPGSSRYESEPGFATRAPTLSNFADRLVHAMASLWRSGTGRARSTASRAAWSAAQTDQQPAQPLPQGPLPPGPIPPGPGGTPSQDPDGQPVAAPDSAAAVPDSAAAASQPPVPADAGVGPSWGKLHGTAAVTGETYSRSGSGAPTRPDRSARVVTGLSVGLMQDRLRVPVTALISGDQVAFRQNINQVGITPRIAWAGLLAGNFSPQYSTYTLADATLLGAGLELTPKNWRIGFVNGRARKAIALNTTAAVQPQYERNVIGGRIGYGDPLANSLELSVLRAKDEEGSLEDPDSLITATPEGNTVYALKAQRILPRQIRAELETALSRYDRDVRADADVVNGTAVGLKLNRETVVSRVGIKVEYLNGGFMTLGNSGITGDRFDVGLGGRLQLLQGRLALDASAGWRNDAVSGIVQNESTRRNYALNGSWQPRPTFGADLQISIFANEVGATDSMPGSSNTTRVFSFAPRATWKVRGVPNTLTGTAMVQTSDNDASGTALLFDTKSVNLLANWSAALSAPWSVTVAGNYTRTDFEVAVSEISTLAPGLSWTAAGTQLQTTAQLQLTRSRTGNAGVDTELAPRVEARWQFSRHQALILRGNFRRYHYGGNLTPEFNERLASLEYATNL